MTIRTGPNNHVEMVHRPGEAALAAKLLTLLGYQVVALPTPLAGTSWQMSSDKILWLSEITPEQQGFEDWLAARLTDAGTQASAAFTHGHRTQPQKYPHFGIGIDTLESWEQTVARLREAATDRDLSGRISVPLVKCPEDEGSVAHATGGKAGRTIYQAFLQTDIFTAGLLTLGQAIEIQHYRENDPNWESQAAAFEKSGTKNFFESGHGHCRGQRPCPA